MAANADAKFDEPEARDLKSWVFGSTASQAREFYRKIGSFKQSNVYDNLIFLCDTSQMVVTDVPVTSKNPSGKRTDLKDYEIPAYGDVAAKCEAKTGVKGQTGNYEGATYILLCPWFLEKTNVLKYPTFNSIKSMFGKPLETFDKIIDKVIPDFDLPAIDLFYSLDQTILHELTHTDAAGHSKDIEGGNSYQWNNVHRISTTSNAWNNAESIAYFAMGVRLIDEGYKISEAGGVKKR
ncbi:hypothetical protein AAE478_006463 [Parahypoxylon ruwenzoriense]